MIPPLNLNVTKAPAVPEEKPCYAEVVECVRAIWNRVYSWISAWISRLFSSHAPTLAEQCPDGFRKVMSYLNPKDVAHSETVCKLWKLAITPEVWKAQCVQR